MTTRLPPSLYTSIIFGRQVNSDNSFSILSYTVNGLCITLITIALASRFYARYRVWKSFNWEELICSLSWLFTCALYAVEILYVFYGGAHHVWKLDASQLQSVRKAEYITYILYVLSVVFIKVLLIAILFRIFAVRQKMARFILGLLIFLLAYYGAVLLVRIFLCTPISAYWIPNSGKCVDTRALFIVDSFISLFTDGAIITLPIVLTWPLHLSISQKVKVVAILGAGGIATVSNIYRLYLTFTSGASTDETTFTTRLIFAGNAEITVGFICTCMPSINQMFSRTRQRASEMS